MGYHGDYALRMYQDQQDEADQADAYYEHPKRAFIARRADEFLADNSTVLSILLHLLDSSRDVLVVQAIKQAIAQSGHCWDGITELERLIRSEAMRRAGDEWDGMPHCLHSDCAADEADFRRADQ